MGIREKIHSIYQRGIKNKWNYALFFDALRNAGVLSCETNVINNQIEYNTKHGKFTERGPLELKVEIGSVYNEEQLISAIHLFHRHIISYQSFLKDIASAGVVHYYLDMNKRTISYFGIDAQRTEYTEQIPDMKKIEEVLFLNFYEERIIGWISFVIAFGWAVFLYSHILPHIKERISLGFTMTRAPSFKGGILTSASLMVFILSYLTILKLVKDFESIMDRKHRL